MLPRCPEWYFAMLAAMRIGAVPMPAPNMLTAKDIAYRIAKAGAVAAVTDDAGSAKIDSITSSLPSLKTKIVASRRGGGERPGWIDLAKATDGVGGIVLPNEPTTRTDRSEEHTSELQSLMRISYAVFWLKKQKQ